jgi:hypothetical protein
MYGMDHVMDLRVQPYDMTHYQSTLYTHGPRDGP